MRVSPSFHVLIARGIQVLFSATVSIITVFLIASRESGPLPPILGSSAGVGLSTLVAGLSTAILRNYLHPWIRNTIDAGILSLNIAVGAVSLRLIPIPMLRSHLTNPRCQMMASEVKGYSCSDEGAYENTVVCAQRNIENPGNMQCFFDSFREFSVMRRRCILYQCNIAFTLSNVPVIFVIWVLVYVRTEKGWRVGGWTIERVRGSYEPVESHNAIPMVAIPDRAHLS